MMGTFSEEVKSKASPEMRRQLAALVKAAIGSSSLQEFSERSGISTGTLSRLRNGSISNIPKIKTLEQIAAAKPENGITLNDLLNACGYEERKESPSGIPLARNGHSIAEEIVSQSGRQLPGSPLLISISLVMNYFFQNKEEFCLGLECHPSYFAINSEKLEHNIIGIPAFLGKNENDTAALTRTMAAMVVTAQYVKDEDELFVITDSQSIFDSLQLAFQTLKGKVLLTKDYISIANR